jgi:hypothetical protein
MRKLAAAAAPFRLAFTPQALKSPSRRVHPRQQPPEQVFAHLTLQRFEAIAAGQEIVFSLAHNTQAFTRTLLQASSLGGGTGALLT